MAKIAQVSAKYIIHSKIFIEGVVDRPDVIGAIFGQTEGLLGADLELRELQKSGRIGRIEVNVDVKSGKTQGEIIIPSSLDKAETAIVGAAIEIIQRIGPCNAKITVDLIEDIRVSKRAKVIERAKELLKDLMDKSMPDSQELSDEVAHSVRMMEIGTFGRDNLSAGPGIEESDEVIVVEGRADVLNLLKHGFKNAISMNGTSVPQTIIDLCKEKTVTVFVDGDRGGSLITQELLGVAEIDYVTRAPDGKEVEELTKKEIHKAIRAKVAAEQAKMEMTTDIPSTRTQQGYTRSGDSRSNDSRISAPQQNRRPAPQQNRSAPTQNSTYRNSTPQNRSAPATPKKNATAEEKKKFGSMLEDLIGTRGAYILDEKLNILGKVPVTELQSTIKSLGTGIHSVVLDGEADKDLINAAERANINFVVAMSTKIKDSSKLNIYTASNL
ncbi:DNA primase [Candidatus Woesearchaeota archaeon]|nr:DNA primase [Candidatus Woesearchaeota archaeon]MCF7900648.1 DNA primase [Candidatus Woesearchaeota archaeon]